MKMSKNIGNGSLVQFHIEENKSEVKAKIVNLR